MSQESWKNEFYQIKAATFRHDKTWLEAAEHSLLKWQGALPLNLEKHGIKDLPIEFDSGNCGLCIKAGAPPCWLCPLYAVRDHVPCYSERDDERLSPYHDDDPVPMIRWLETTVKYCKKRGI